MRMTQVGLSGLVLLGGATAGANTITTVDSGGVGQFTSVVYGADALPLIAYYDVANGDLKVAHCQDVACTVSTKQTLDSTGDVGKHASVAIGANGLGLIGYLDATNARIKVARCNDLACSTASTVSLTSAGPASEGADIAVPADGRPVLAFRDAAAGLRFARCTDPVCSDAAAVTLSPTFGRHPTIAIGGDGLPLVAGSNGANLFLSHCNDADCGAAAPVSLGEPAHEGAFLAIEINDPVLARRSDGRGVIAFSVRETTAINQSLLVRVRTCADAACSSLVGNGTIGIAGVSGVGLPASVVPGLATGEGDVSVVSATQPTNGTRLRVAQCSTLSCFGAVGVEEDGPGAGQFSSAAVSPAGVGLVAYQADAGGGSLRTIYLDTVPTADMSLASMLASPNPVGVGQEVLLYARVQNLGPGVARGNAVTHTLPPGAVDVSGIGCTLLAPGSIRCPLGDMFPGLGLVDSVVQARIPAGLTGPLTASATVTTTSIDPNPANDSASVSIGIQPTLRIRSPLVREGHSGQNEGRVEVELIDNGSPPASVTASYTTGGGSATPGADYVPVSGSLTFTPGASVQGVTVSVVGDLLPEGNEGFFLQLTSATATPLPDGGVIILDDDLLVPVQGELAHGTRFVASLEGTGSQDHFVVEEPARASIEIVADDISADVRPLSMVLLGPTGVPTGFGSTTSSLGGTVRIRYDTGDTPQLTRFVRIQSGGCATCGADDIYRLRAYETTARIARFNNTGDQTTVLILQNPSDETAEARVSFWSPAGEDLGVTTLSLPAHGVSVLSTALVVPGQSGSITIQHDLSYGVLQGKAVAFEPATGFSFDSPLTYRPR